MKRPNVTVMLATVMLAGLFAAGCDRHVRMYPGARRDAADVAMVHNTWEVLIAAVDGRPRGQKMGVAPGDLIVDLEPGEHRLTVGHYDIEYRDSTKQVTDETGATVSRIETEMVWVMLSPNFLTIRHRFEAGKAYTFQRLPTSVVAGVTMVTWDPKLIEMPGGTVVATYETEPPPAPAHAHAPAPAPPQGFATTAASTSTSSGGDGATVAGVAQLEVDGIALTATGRKLVLLPDVPEARAWLRRSNAFYNRWLRFFPPKLPAKLRARARWTWGIATGHYQFDNVPPGHYLVVFERWDDEDYKKRFGVSEVSVAEGTPQAEVKPMRRFTETTK